VYSVLGSLADQVLYPKTMKADQRTPEIEKKMMDALERVGVDYLISETRFSWDEVKKWEDTLSGGEQQRLGLARLFYHVPRFAVLDECTDAVSVDVEKSLYTRLLEKGVTCITISKRLALQEFHDREFKLGVPNEKGWELSDIPHNDTKQV
jgi:ABC-type uncharacterized transport system fused permease/ATPase subunit